ncbi:MAG: heterodisulfide reductase-related iron-sulfur binding cluster [Thermaerobacter sp.]|nr:heterodisulfide reductase-related iron-sulfur binding cluster [Thermaerobacter sp.]
MSRTTQGDPGARSVRHYPGCQAAVVYHERLLATEEIAACLGLAMDRMAPEDCCGGVEDPPNFFSGIVAPLRLVDLAGEDQLATSCLSCLANLRGAFRRMDENPETRRRAAFSMQVVGYRVPEGTGARHLLDLLAQGDLAAAVAERAVGDLSGLRAAVYYGCRKGELAERTPAAVEETLRSLGVELVSFAAAEECCGAPKGYRGGLPGGKGQAVLQGAAQAGAEVVVTVCGMCQANLEKQRGGPVVIPFLQLLAVPLGMAEREVWLRRNDTAEGGRKDA